MSYDLNNSKRSSDFHNVVHVEQQFPHIFPAHDALSSVLDSIHLHSAYIGRPIFHAMAPWGFHVPKGPTSFNVITQGRCWLSLKEKAPLLLEQGDMIVVVHGVDICMQDDLQSDIVHIEKILPFEQVGKQKEITFGGDGDQTSIVCGCFFLNSTHHQLLSALPDVIHIKNENGQPVRWLSGILDLLANECTGEHPGSSVFLNHLVSILFIQTIRTYLSTASQDNKKWPDILLNSDIQSALNLIHTSPERPWSVILLARNVGMSRSAFAAKFTQLLGISPMKYLLDFRMHKAATLLQNGQHNLKEIAAQIGYHSESAFSNAFKRWAKISPSAYRESRTHAKA
jgi:AraC family transcriptional regulator, alkane utilization regulator